MSDNESNESLQNLEDIYQLAPMQQGMLFHSIYSPDSGTYLEQTLFTIKGALDLEAFEQAWQSVVDRHSILRTSFLWEGLEKPVQVVHRRVDLEIAKHDWRDLPPAGREQQLESFIDADRRRDFVLSDDPLLRLALFRFTEDEHKFLFSRHHILIDRWSRALLLKDFFALYEALSKGKQARLDVLRPYGDYITWLAQQDANEAEAFWRIALAGFTEPTGFAPARQIDRPTDPPVKDPSVKDGDAYAGLRTQLSEAATENLQSFARQHRLTLNTLAQGAWALLLKVYSGDDDVLFGVTVSGRPATLPGVESMVGLFINTLPLRATTPAHSSVLSWLKDLQQQQATVQQYEYSSLVDIQGWSEVPRGVPLFESIFVFENLPAGGGYESETRGVEIRADRGLGSTTGYPLTVLVSPGARITVQIVYDRARFEPEAIQRMLGHFQTLLQNLPDHSAGAISGLPLLTDTEREQIVHQWNDTQVAYGVDSVVPLFEAQAARTPEATAVEFENQQLSYRELNARANQLAAYLRGLGLGGDDRVGICIDRSLEMAVAVLGVLKAGAAYVPLDPAYPLERLTFMLEDAQCQVVLTSERLAETLPQASTGLLCLDKDWDRVKSESAENPPTQIAGENLAYVIYTSGSTGWPKGVALEHRALANLISWQLDQSFTPARTLQFASLSFDVSFQELFSTWCSGGTLLLVSDELRRDAPSLLRFFDRQKVERIFLPFVYLQHLAEAFPDNDARLDHLREIITAGEQLEITPQIAHLCNSLKALKLHNHYGPSESHVVTAHTLTGKPNDWPTLPPIGRPISNTQIYILDRCGQPTPVGVAGELCIGGANLARGYLNRPELTAEKFVSNPFSDNPAARIYRTGDLARFTSEGIIEFLGRFDNQIKIRGFRIELGEIEATLCAHPSVREAVVVVQDDAGDRRLLGYVVPSTPESDELATELRRFLKTKLPDYMTPSDFVFLEALPLTPSGKINRRALPAPDLSAKQSENLYVPPQTEMERQLVEIWCNILRRERIGVEDNFFELGGESLLATRVISQVRTAFKVELPLRHLFESPTVAGLASVLSNYQSSGKAATQTVITKSVNTETDELLEKLDQLSDEDVDALLQDALAENS